MIGIRIIQILIFGLSNTALARAAAIFSSAAQMSLLFSSIESIYYDIFGTNGLAS
jgi:hypothetical protein